MGRQLYILRKVATNKLQLLYNFNLSLLVFQNSSISKDFPYVIQLTSNKQNNITAFNDHIEISVTDTQTINIDIIFNFVSIGNPNIVILFGGNTYNLYTDNNIAKGSLTKTLSPGLYKLYILSDKLVTISNNFNNILINFVS